MVLLMVILGRKKMGRVVKTTRPENDKQLFS